MDFNVLESDSIPHIVLVVDNDNKIIYINKYASTVGFRIDDILKIAVDICFVEEKIIDFETTIKLDKGNYGTTEIEVMINKVEEYSTPKSTLLFIQNNSHCHMKKNNFMANISHEIRSSLNGSIGVISLLNDTTLDNNQKKYMDILKSCSHNLMCIVNDILEFSKLEAGKLIITEKLFNLKECVSTTIDIVIHKAKDKNIEINSSVDEDIPEYIIGDAQRIRQILINLISNSIKAVLPKYGKIYSHVSLVKENNSSFLLFSIIDNGIGIKEHEKQNLFISYHQMFNQHTDKFNSSIGLGLTICKNLCKLMGGDIWLKKSNYSTKYVNSGTEFNFKVNVKLPDISSKQGFGCCFIDNQDCSDMDIMCLKKKSILVVDDNETNRFLVSKILLKYDVLVHSCSSIAEALLFVDNYSFDLALLDIILPNGETGITLAEKIKEKNKDIMICALSSINQKIQSFEKDTSLFDRILLKPINENTLIYTIINLINPKKKEEIPDNSDISILIDEDIQYNTMILLKMLNQLGYSNVKIVENGEKAIKAMKSREFDICFVDIKTPELDGYKVLREFRKMSRRTYLIALTAFCIEPAILQSIGFDNFLFKPFEISCLKNILIDFNTNKPL